MSRQQKKEGGFNAGLQLADGDGPSRGKGRGCHYRQPQRDRSQPCPAHPTWELTRPLWILVF